MFEIFLYLNVTISLAIQINPPILYYCGTYTLGANNISVVFDLKARLHHSKTTMTSFFFFCDRVSEHVFY